MELVRNLTAFSVLLHFASPRLCQTRHQNATMNQLLSIDPAPKHPLDLRWGWVLSVWTELKEPGRLRRGMGIQEGPL